jgi:hypothetical protein
MAWRSVADGSEVQYTAGFTPEKSEITLGEPVYLAFNLTNTGSNTMLMSVREPLNKAEFSNFSFW